MYRLLPAIVLSAGLQSAFAAAAVPAPVARAPEAIVQAQLEVTGDPAGPRHSTSTGASKSVAKDGAHDEEQRPAAMLLAALILMTGIALRRWGMGQQ